MRRCLSVLSFLSVFLVACASAGTHTGSSNENSSHLTSQEITAANLPTAYDLVDRLRRPWLRDDAATGGEVSVYVDNQKLGGKEKLRDIPAVDVAEMHFLPSADAVMHFGQDATGGAIVVIRKR